MIAALVAVGARDIRDAAPGIHDQGELLGGRTDPEPRRVVPARIECLQDIIKIHPIEPENKKPTERKESGDGLPVPEQTVVEAHASARGRRLQMPAAEAIGPSGGVDGGEEKR